MTEDNQLLVEAELAALRARVVGLEEGVAAVAGPSVQHGIAPDLTEGAGGLALDSKVCFGHKIDGTTVTIYSGEIDRIAVAETNVASVANDNFVYVRRTIADDTMLVTKGASVPADDATYKYYKLYQFSVASGTASIKRIWRPFAIEGAERELPSNANTSQYHVLQISADVGAADDPTKWTIGTVKWI